MQFNSKFFGTRLKLNSNISINRLRKNNGTHYLHGLDRYIRRILCVVCKQTRRLLWRVASARTNLPTLCEYSCSSFLCSQNAAKPVTLQTTWPAAVDKLLAAYLDKPSNCLASFELASSPPKSLTIRWARSTS